MCFITVEAIIGVKEAESMLDDFAEDSIILDFAKHSNQKSRKGGKISLKTIARLRYIKRT